MQSDTARPPSADGPVFDVFRCGDTANVPLPEEIVDRLSHTALRDQVLEAVSGVYLADSVSWALELGAIVSEGDGDEAAARLGLLAVLLRDAVAATADPAGHGVVHRERFADLARLGEADARRLLDAAKAALDRFAADFEGPRLNVRLACEAYALGLPESS